MSRSAVVLWSFIMWVPALAACVVVSVPVAALGLSVSGWIVFPLAFASGGLLTAIVAGWIDNLVFAGSGKRRRFLLILGWTELIAALVFGLFVLTSVVLHLPVILLTELLVADALITTGAVLVTHRLRA